MRSAAVVALTVLMLALSTPAYVHHSGAMFDRTREIKITGAVTEFQWTNPHASFKVDVLGDDGKTETWSIEMNGPNNLVRAGWKRTTIKAGDKVTVTVNPLRDGRPGGWYLGITLADGRDLHKFIAHAIGSLEVPMTDQALERKFADLADGVIPAAQAQRLMALCWKLESLENVAEIAKGAAAA